MRSFVMRWVSHKGLHDTKKFLIRLDCMVMKSSSDVFFDAGILNGIWSSEGSIKRLLINWMWEFVIVLVITGARACNLVLSRKLVWMGKTWCFVV